MKTRPRPRSEYGHSELKPMIAKSFAHHKMKSGPGHSWRLAKPGTGIYAFRVTWAPGILVISGDIGDETYRVWPSFSTLWGAIELVDGAGWDYLTGKSTAKKVYDRDATVEHFIEEAYDYLRNWSTVLEGLERAGKAYGRNPRNPKDRKALMIKMREDSDLTAERFYDLTWDSESLVYAYESETRWTYEALQLWAKTMIEREPRWHRAWRWLSKEWRNARRLRHDGILFRPRLYVRSEYWSAEVWTLRFFEWQGKRRARMAAVYPVKVFGVGLCRLGLWRLGGSSWPINFDRRARKRPFVPARP